MFELILVSQSPRRRELLTKAGFHFRYDHTKISEIIDENLNLDDALMKLARQKSEAYLNEHKSLKSQSILLLSADTVVAMNGQIFGKPESKTQACEYLSILSQKTHSVKTSVCVYDLVDCLAHCRVTTSSVTFRQLSKEEIHEYVETGEPMDKAGAYGIQGGGKAFVEKFEGPWDNIVGLPIKTFQEILDENGFEIARTKN